MGKTTQLHYENLAKMYNLVKRTYSGNKELAVLFPEDGKAEHSNGYTYNIDSHELVLGTDNTSVNIQLKYNSLANRYDNICVFHNHMNATLFSPRDIATFFKLEKLTCLVADSGESLVLLHKTKETYEHAKQYADKNGKNAINNIIAIEVPKIHKKASDYIRQNAQNFSDLCNTLQDSNSLNDNELFEKYVNCQKQVSSFISTQFEKKFAINYFTVPKENLLDIY
ncbi:MAG: hypothetical protein FWC89_04625 [Defluviitaleaceae bacterium]|nr:hypothetical protein [Defluviitaleaceae bacterium]